MKEDQTIINDYFDPDQFTRSINEVSVVREKVNETFGNEKSITVKPILDMLYKNALKMLQHHQAVQIVTVRPLRYLHHLFFVS